MREIDAKEIIKRLKLRVKNGTYTDDLATTIRVSNEVEAYDLAIKALNKQTPQEVKRKIRDNEEYAEQCPTCGHFVCGNYCYECGQKLEWN